MNHSNAGLLQRDHRHLLHSLHDKNTHLAGNVWLRGEGCELLDADGKRYIDGMSGLWNVTLGYGQPSLIAAASKQMAELAYASSYAGSSNLRALELAEKLAAISYPDINRFFFSSGGGESTDSTVKTARSYWKARGQPGKYKTICLQGGYHGTTLGAMSATGLPTGVPLSRACPALCISRITTATAIRLRTEAIRPLPPPMSWNGRFWPRVRTA